jgi:hypothetical protein
MMTDCECVSYSLLNSSNSANQKLIIFRDKRPYEFADVSQSGNIMIRKRTPDLTFGLGMRPSPCSDASDDARGWCETVVADSLDNVHVEPGNDMLTAGSAARHSSIASSLCSKRLRALAEHHKCGLIVDPRWGEANLVFPWAVYEVKKDTWNDTFSGKGVVDFQSAEAQIYQAAQMFLGMLDDLARDPDRIGEYHSAKSNRFQLFGFTSVANHWRTYVAFEKDGECVSTKALFDASGASLIPCDSTSRQYGRAMSSISIKRSSSCTWWTKSISGQSLSTATLWLNTSAIG